MKDLTVVELLSSPISRPVTIRSICAWRKTMATAPQGAISEIDISISAQIERLYHSINSKEREDAFAQATRDGTYGRKTVESTPLVPPKPVRKQFGATAAGEYLERWVKDCVKDEALWFDFISLADWVETAHLHAGEHQWLEIDTVKVNNTVNWKNALHQALQNFKKAGKVAYSTARSEWVVLIS